MPFFCLDTKETKDQGTGCYLGFTISATPEPLFCRCFFNYLQKNATQFDLETGTSKCRKIIECIWFVPPYVYNEKLVKLEGIEGCGKKVEETVTSLSSLHLLEKQSLENTNSKL